MNENPIVIFKKRDFGEFISAPISFLTKEFKQLSLTLLLFVGPIILLNILVMKYMGLGYVQDVWNIIRSGGAIDYSQGYGYAFIIQLISLAETIVLYTVSAVYVKVYQTRGSGNFEIKDVTNEFSRRIGQTSLAMFLSFLIMIVGFFIFLIPGIYLAVVFYIFCAVIVFEEISFGEAFSRIFEIMKGNWWMTFGTFIVLALIAGIVNAIVSAILSSLFAFVGYSGIIFIIISTIKGVVSLFITSVLGLLPIFLYASFVADKENPVLMDRIDQITEENEDTNIFTVKNEEDEQKVEKEDDELIKKEEDPKTEDKWGEMFDDEEKNNRFESEDDNDRFKPKY
ncbi:MAG: hypothetical protein K8R54_10790 [Bacteroidales bacterium]|nr:hypothetical protein [Bacteroidales bacterium]